MVRAAVLSIAVAWRAQLQGCTAAAADTLCEQLTCRSYNLAKPTFALARRSAVVEFATTTRPGFNLGGTTGEADTILLQTLLLLNPLANNREATD
jgi:hypothetical protein